jgi:hypothetical protein
MAAFLAVCVAETIKGKKHAQFEMLEVGKSVFWRIASTYPVTRVRRVRIGSYGEVRQRFGDRSTSQ